ncbi:MAG: hypothetical protein JSV88_09030 [Candidatus Aminicenantes bacterium]|nr:MAG: hypothetical protein JSV88_09030 [Candidatus Aminicenantes bacterium]
MKTFKKLKLLAILIGLGIIYSGCCSLFPNLPKCEQDREFTPPSITRLCPSHIGGNRDFAGHGPDVQATASLELRNSRTEIWVKLYLHAKETRSDWTEAEGTWNRKLWTVDPGYTISRIVSDQSSNASYRDVDHDLDRPSVVGGNLVDKFEIMGDTSGNDVGNCTSDDVYMNVYFNKVEVKVKRITP